jgi:hypothetical protein
MRTRKDRRFVLERHIEKLININLMQNVYLILMVFKYSMMSTLLIIGKIIYIDLECITERLKDRIQL